MLDPILEKGSPSCIALVMFKRAQLAWQTPKSGLFCIAGCSRWVNEALKAEGYTPENFAVLPPGSPCTRVLPTFSPPKFDRLRICFAGLMMLQGGRTCSSKR